MTDADRPGPNKRELDRSQAEKCRAYVIDVVGVQRQSVSVADVAKMFTRTEAALRNDVQRKMYDKKGYPIGILDGRLFYDESRLTTEGRRKHEDVSEKTKIGEMGAHLVVGPVKWDSADM